MSPKGRSKVSTGVSAVALAAPKVSYHDPLWEYTNRTNPSQVDPTDIPRMAELARSRFPARQEHGVLLLRKVLSIDNDPPIEEVLATGVADTLVKVLKTSTSTTVQFEACWALSNLCSGTHEQLVPVQKAGVIPAAAELLKTTASQNCLEQAAWTLGNICGDSASCRDEVLAQDIFPTLRRQLLEPNASYPISVHRNIAWLLAQTVRLAPKPPRSYMEEVVSLCSELLKVSTLDDEVATDIIWALTYIAESPEGGIEVVRSSGAMDTLVEGLQHRVPGSGLAGVVRVLGAFAQSDLEEHSSYVLSLPGFEPLFQVFLSSPKHAIQKDGFWCLSNLAASGSPQATALASKEKLMGAALRSVANPRLQSTVRMEAMYLILNVISAVDFSVVKDLIGKFGLLDAIAAAVVSCQTPEKKFKDVTCDTVWKVFDIAVAIAVVDDSEEQGLLSVVTSALHGPMMGARQNIDRIDSLCAVFFDSTNPAYYRIIHPQKAMRFAIPSDLIRATDITDRIGSFVSHDQLIPLTHSPLLSLEEFPTCCQFTAPPLMVEPMHTPTPSAEQPPSCFLSAGRNIGAPLHSAFRF